MEKEHDIVRRPALPPLPPILLLLSPTPPNNPIKLRRRLTTFGAKPVLLLLLLCLFVTHPSPFSRRRRRRSLTSCDALLFLLLTHRFHCWRMTSCGTMLVIFLLPAYLPSATRRPSFFKRKEKGEEREHALRPHAPILLPSCH